MSFKSPFLSSTLFSSLALLTVCSLAFACGEEHKSTHPQALTPKSAEKIAQESLPKPLDLPLTATAPAAPRSVLDSRNPPAVGELKATEGQQAKPEPVSVSPEQVKLDRFVLATDVLQREPVGESEHFTTETPKIFAFMQFANEQAPFAVKVHWEKLGDPASPYGTELLIPTAARHRTWSWTKIREPGTYRAVVRTVEGQELASKEFTIEAAAQQDAAE